MNIVGTITNKLNQLLNLPTVVDPNIYIGPTNIAHMQSSHPQDYAKYGSEISNIINNPDYVGVNPKDNSLEFVKEYLIDNEFVKVAVRVSSQNKYYARSLYILNSNRVNNFISRGTLLKT